MHPRNDQQGEKLRSLLWAIESVIQFNSKGKKTVINAYNRLDLVWFIY